ncbi:hypothetical protein [Entomohabitans teleogrylli]|uniref:hypothetical protein n=1 Tax=Entomohabitans teleogrylli TaxID=1384589 RepID=UPI00073D4ED4|nr:hypothetical protein [Entomohabitans teleogrylli]
MFYRLRSALKVVSHFSRGRAILFNPPTALYDYPEIFSPALRQWRTTDKIHYNQFRGLLASRAAAL